MRDFLYFKAFGSIIIENLKKINFFNLMTVIESLSYNKWLFRIFDCETITKILKESGEKLSCKELANLPKYTNLLYYI